MPVVCCTIVSPYHVVQSHTHLTSLHLTHICCYRSLGWLDCAFSAWQQSQVSAQQMRVQYGYSEMLGHAQ
jgi:hypothetical protein